MSSASINTKPMLPWFTSGGMKLSADGNSITAGTQDGPESNGGVPGYLNRNVYPFSSQGYANLAIGGQNITDMISSPSDVDTSFDSSKVCLLFVQEGTNQANTATTPEQNWQLTKDFILARRAARAWSCIVVATAAPVYIGDQVSQAYTNDYNAKLDVYNALVRSQWRSCADWMVETRCPGSPYAQDRYPNYLKATFYDTTVINGISNTNSFITEPSGGSVPNCKIHYTAAGIAILAPLIGKQLLQARRRV